MKVFKKRRPTNKLVTAAAAHSVNDSTGTFNYDITRRCFLDLSGLGRVEDKNKVYSEEHSSSAEFYSSQLESFSDS